jgi:hypothetical protein
MIQEDRMKKHLRMTTAALAALGLAIVGCETDDTGTTGDTGVDAPADDGLGTDPGTDDGLGGDDTLTDDGLGGDDTLDDTDAGA